jgi:alpha-1,6-mannosyltransferase
MKTLHVTNAYHPASGGVRTFYQALLSAGNRLRRPVCVVTPAAQDAVIEVGEFGRLYEVAAPRAPFFDPGYRLLLPHLFLFPFHGALRDIVRLESPDVIEVSDKYALCYLAGLIRKGWIAGLGRPLLVGASHERMDDSLAAYLPGRRWARRFASWYMRRIYLPQFDLHLANSEYTAQEVQAGIESHRRDRVRVAPLGVAADWFSPVRRRSSARLALLEETHLPSHTRLVLYAGRLSKEKNLELLLGMMAHLPPGYALLVAGTGPQRDWLVHSSRARQLPIHSLGHVSDREFLADLYANCDVFVHPNPCEPFGIAPLEAMASGCPVVLPAAGGVLAYAGQHNAWLCSADPAAFAAAVQSVDADPYLRSSRLSQARRTAEAFAWNRVIEQFFALLDEWHERPDYAA